MCFIVKMCDHQGMCTCGEYSFADPFGPEPVQDPDAWLVHLVAMTDKAVWLSEQYQQELVDFDKKIHHKKKSEVAQMRQKIVDKVNWTLAPLTYVAHQRGLIVPSYW